MQTKEEFVYDFHISQNIMSMSLRMKLRTLQRASVLKQNKTKSLKREPVKVKINLNKNMASGSETTIPSSKYINLCFISSSVTLCKFLGISYYTYKCAYYL